MMADFGLITLVGHEDLVQLLLGQSQEQQTLLLVEDIHMQEMFRGSHTLGHFWLNDNIGLYLKRFPVSR